MKAFLDRNAIVIFMILAPIAAGVIQALGDWVTGK